jgi:hypothetical protein
MKKILSLLLALVLAVGLAVPALAVNTGEAQDAAQLLYNLSLFRGVGTNADGTPQFDLDRAPTRAEAVTILVRLLGAEEEATAKNWSTPFTDVPNWAKPYVGYAYNRGLTNGVETNRFGATDSVTTAQFLTFVLRALGYSDGTDFVWTSPWTLTDKLGITAGDYSAATKTFYRADAAYVCANALQADRKTGETLLEYLLNAGSIGGSTVVIWDYTPVSFQDDFASFLFYPVKGSPATFTTFKIDRVTVNGLACETLQVTSADSVSAYLASIGVSNGGFGYIELSYDEAAASAAATSYQTVNGKRYPVLDFAFTYTGTQADGTKVTGSFTASYYFD